MKPSPPGTVRSPLGTGFRWSGLFFSEGHAGSTWIREVGTVKLPCPLEGGIVVVEGELLPAPDGDRAAKGTPGLELVANGRALGRFFPEVGPFT